MMPRMPPRNYEPQTLLWIVLLVAIGAFIALAHNF